MSWFSKQRDLKALEEGLDRTEKEREELRAQWNGESIGRAIAEGRLHEAHATIATLQDALNSALAAVGTARAEGEQGPANMAAAQAVLGVGDDEDTEEAEPWGSPAKALLDQLDEIQNRTEPSENTVWLLPSIAEQNGSADTE